ncbi:MAG TPA: M48 family metalloprotease, partial [Archangium sp.]
MKLARLVGMLAGAYLLSGCAALSSMGIKAPVDLPKPPPVIEEGQAKAKAKCDPIRNAEVAWPEERAMGGVVSIKQVANFGGLVMDGMASTDPDALAKDVLAKKPVTLPDSAKNDLGAYVAVVGRNLARYSARPDISWTFAVMENDTPNAFSSPGGYIVVTTGLLKKTQNEAQLAGVLGHEIGHIVHKHSIKRYRSVKADQCAVATFGAHVVKSGVQAALQFLPPEARDAAKFADKFDNFDLDDPNNGDFVV